MPRFIHMADLHLDARMGYLPEEKQQVRKKELLDAFGRAVDFACDSRNGIDGVIVAGDLFDTATPPQELVRQVSYQFERLEVSGIDAFVVPGTHDSSIYPGSIFRRHPFPGVTLMRDPNVQTPVTREYDGIPFYFYGMEFHPLLSKKPYGSFHALSADGVHIAVIHGSLMEKNHWQAQDIHVPLSPDDLAESGMDYVALGHYHNFAQHQLGRVMAVYPGSPEGTRFAEAGERYLVVVNISGPGQVMVEKIPWSRRTFMEWEIDLAREGMESERDIIDRIMGRAAGEGERLLLRVRLTGSREFPVSLELLRREPERVFFHFQVEDETTMIDSEVITGLARERSVRGLFVRKMLDRIAVAQGRDRQVLSFALKTALKEMQGDEAVEV
jgi:DNA repair exonuclease SbcCD nuclease subunit